MLGVKLNATGVPHSCPERSRKVSPCWREEGASRERGPLVSNAIHTTRPNLVALGSGFWVGITNLVLLITLGVAVACAGTEPTVEELKARISSANAGDKAKICVEIAEKQLTAVDKLYAADDSEKAQTSLTDVVAFTELARDYSIQSHKHQKQIEISVRSMTRKLNDLLHVVSHEEQAPLKDAIKHLEHVRDDLLAAMFPKGAK